MSELKSVLEHTLNVHKSLITDTDSGDMTILEKQDMEPVIEIAKSMREANTRIGTHTHVGKSHMRPVAEVPMMIYNQSIREGWTKADWRKWINNPDNKAFRITDGRF